MRSSGLVFLFVGTVFALTTVFAGASNAGVDVSVGVNVPLPLYVAPAPPPVVVIPGSYVYYVPDVDVDILFYHGYWYRPHGQYWYRSSSYNGPWHHMAPHGVPHALVSLPPNYRHMPPRYGKIPYGHLKKNWAKWERERYWHHNDWGHRGERGIPGGGYKGKKPDHRPDKGGHKGPDHHQPGHGERGGHGRGR